MPPTTEPPDKPLTDELGRQPSPAAEKERSERSFAARIFLSPEERRLRAGWRLLVHSMLTILLSLPLVVLLALGLELLGLMGLEGSLEGFTPALFVVAVPATTIATWIARRFIDRRSFRSLGFHLDRYAFPDLAIGFLIPGLLFGLIFAFDWGMGWMHFEGWRWQADGWVSAAVALTLGLISFIAVGFYEELLFRGYYLRNLSDGLSPGWGVAVSSAAFGLVHMQNPSASNLSTVGLVLAGLYLAYAWIRSRRLWLPIGLHIGWNFFEGTVFGFPVSGLDPRGLLLQRIEGPELVTGGTFGPEAGLVILPAMLLGSAIIYFYTRDRTISKGALDSTHSLSD